MLSRLHRNWIAVGVIWAGALGMTWLNLRAVGQIRAAQASIGVMQAEDTFLKNNFEKITHVLQQRASLHKSIDSIPIELLSLENNLRSLAREQHLSEFQLEPATTAGQFDRLPLSVEFSGPFKGLVIWLRALEADMPFLVVNGVWVDAKKEGQGYRFRVDMDLRFKISDSGNSAA